MTLRVAVVAVVAVSVLAVALLQRRPATTASMFPAVGESELAAFQAGTPDAATYARLFAYFVLGFETYRTPGGAGARYPGLPSRNGESADTLEGFSRTMPLVAAWTWAGRPATIHLATGHSVALPALFRRGLLAGTNPASPEFWGDIRDLDQRIPEASDVALSLWLLRDRVWVTLTQAEKDQVVRWLRQVEGRQVPDNNWHLYPVFVDAVLRSLGIETNRRAAAAHYDRFKQFSRTGGWFSDGPGDVFDYYNAWSMHYQLFWLQRVDPAWDGAFISERRREFLRGYRLLIGPQGVPIMGRSVCYRMAAPAPVVLGSWPDEQLIPPGEARRGLDAVWSFFIRKGAIRSGNVTQGYCGRDARVLDNYSGPASCLWSLRSLVAAFAIPDAAEFWTGGAGTLPVEDADYEARIDGPGWTITGERRTGAVRLAQEGVREADRLALADYGVFRRIASGLFRRPFRPDNHPAKYGQRVYDSAEPFCGCAP